MSKNTATRVGAANKTSGTIRLCQSEKDGLPLSPRGRLQQLKGGLLRQTTLALLVLHFRRLRREHLYVASTDGRSQTVQPPTPSLHVEHDSSSVQYHWICSGGSGHGSPADLPRLGGQRVWRGTVARTTRTVGLSLLLLQTP